LGENFVEFTKNKFSTYDNFQIVNADFETYDFGNDRFDLVYSAAAFQWIPEKIGYPKAYNILKKNGTFAMLVTRPDMRPGGGYTDEPLYSKIQEIYSQYFRPEINYTCKLDYDVRGKYGFTELECRQYHKTREYNADDYVSLIGTHADHITLQEPYKTKFYESIREAILSSDNKIKIYDNIVLYLAKKS
jgi:ubiquinone/menaquinone biosynthesis C-methylase UbiE